MFYVLFEYSGLLNKAVLFTGPNGGFHYTSEVGFSEGRLCHQKYPPEIKILGQKVRGTSTTSRSEFSMAVSLINIKKEKLLLHCLFAT